MTDKELEELDRDCGNCIYTELNAEDPPCCYCSHVTGTKDYFTPISNEQSMKQRRVPSEDVQRAIDYMTTKLEHEKQSEKLWGTELSTGTLYQLKDGTWINEDTTEKTKNDVRQTVKFLMLSITALRQMQGWIPVSERLPENETTVLTFYKDNSGYEEFRASDYDDTRYQPYWNNVTHWMPMPPKP